MALRNIRIQGDPGLRKKAREVGKVNEHIREILTDLRDTMHEAGGVGLAAPQVGILRRIFVAEPEEGELFYMVDPEIYEREGEQTGEEGCLSVPGMVGTVTRPMKIRIRALGIDGQDQDLTFTDFAARVMCHEYDHLEGRLYVDMATDMRKAEAGGDDKE